MIITRPISDATACAGHLPRSRSLLSVLTICALVLVGCGGDGPLPPEPRGPTGSVTFNFSGAHSGEFRAEGELSQGLQDITTHGTWAAAAWIEDEQQLGIVAFRGHSPPRGDGFALALGNISAPGTVTLNGEACLLGEEDDCMTGWVGFDTPFAQHDPMADDVFFITSGTVTISTYTTDRLVGSFAGTAVHLLDLAMAVPEPRTLTIANGSFDVPLLREQTGGVF
jgi:hypothetical protein